MYFDIEEIRRPLEKEIQLLPENFYDTFDYTKTGNNLTHPITLGILCNILYALSWVERIGIDAHLNLGNKQKFQPDFIVINDITESNEVKLFLDYESPNSSDARIPKKDVDNYNKWTSHKQCQTPYVIITTLPNKLSDHWELRWTSEKKACNRDFRDNRAEIRKNPFMFWYKHYRDRGCFQNKNIYFLNIDGRKVKHINKTTLESLLPEQSTPTEAG